jgi:hypothetical protein
LKRPRTVKVFDCGICWDMLYKLVVWV